MDLSKYGMFNRIPPGELIRVSPQELQSWLGLAPGARVRIEGLSKAELNGKHARVVGFIEDKERWQVRMEEGSNEFAVLPERLVVVEPPRTGSFSIQTILLDVRDPDEYERGHVPSALNVPYTNMFMKPEKSLEIMKTWPLSRSRFVCYSGKGVDNAAASRDLSALSWINENLGVATAHLACLDGGFDSWLKNGRPVITGYS